MPRIAVNGTTLHVVDRGSGPPLLFVHGFPLTHDMWQGQLDEFAGDYRVLAPDLRGFGVSDPVPAEPLTMEQHADDLAALLDAVDVTEPVILCGLSMGGYIGWQFALRHGKRLRALIQCDTRAAADAPDTRAGRMKLAETVLNNGAEAAATPMLPKLFAAATRDRSPEVIDRIRETIVGTRRETIAAALYGMAQRPDVTPRLPEIAAPTLLLAGEDDLLTPAKEMRAIAERLPHATFVEIADAGHMAPVEQPAAVNRALREFLDTLPA
ncbi:MAG: alpha/beta hydrolase [Planctomycetes bacterium]|nr:alpha/beta hydrolase [Planctomycetota bacterium]